MILLYQIKRDKRDKFRPVKNFFGKSENLIKISGNFQQRLVMRNLSLLP